jgi:hypothetical protein
MKQLKYLVSVLMVLCLTLFVGCPKDDDNKGGDGGKTGGANTYWPTDLVPVDAKYSDPVYKKGNWVAGTQAMSDSRVEFTEKGSDGISWLEDPRGQCYISVRSEVSQSSDIFDFVKIEGKKITVKLVRPAPASKYVIAEHFASELTGTDDIITLNTKIGIEFVLCDSYEITDDGKLTFTGGDFAETSFFKNKVFTIRE